MQSKSPIGTPTLRLIVGGAPVRESKPAPLIADADFSIEEVEITDDGLELTLFDRDGAKAVLVAIGNDELLDLPIFTGVSEQLVPKVGRIERFAKALAKRQIIGGPPDAAA